MADYRHYLVVTHTDAAVAGLRGDSFYSRSIFTHVRSGVAALIASLVVDGWRAGVSAVAAYDVTEAYERNDHAGMFPATRDDMTSDLPNLLAVAATE